MKLAYMNPRSYLLSCIVAAGLASPLIAEDPSLQRASAKLTALVGNALALPSDAKLRDKTWALQVSLHEMQEHRNAAELMRRNGAQDVFLSDLGQLFVRADAKSIKKIASLPEVKFIDVVAQPVHNFEVGGGVSKTGAETYHLMVPPQKGQGVKVAVLDFGFGGLSQAIEQGEFLKSDGVTSSIDLNCLFNYETNSGGSIAAIDCDHDDDSCFQFILNANDNEVDRIYKDHGTGVAQIVHDMAPDADLCLKNLGSSGAMGYFRAITDATNEGVNIINASFGFLNSSYHDGLGQVSRAVDLTADSVFWSVAAGNQARIHWSGKFQDEDNDAINDFLVFTIPGTEIRIIDETNTSLALQNREGQPYYKGEEIKIHATWDDWDESNGVDYDIHLMRGSACGENIASREYLVQNSVMCEEAGVQFTCGQDRQADGGGGAPSRETIVYKIPAVTTDQFCIAVSQFAGSSNREITLFASGTYSHLTFQPQYHQRERSLTAPAVSESAFAVGAVGLDNWVTSPSELEPYSSVGPRKVSHLVLDPLAKPDIVGPTADQIYLWDNENLFGFDEFTYQDFGGTSAAAPHVAGCAALLLADSSGSLTASQLRELLRSTAKNRGVPGQSNETGWGQLDCRYGLAVDASGPEEAQIGEVMEHHVTAFNRTTTGQDNVCIETYLPSGLEFIDSDPSGICNLDDIGKLECCATYVEAASTLNVSLTSLVTSLPERGFILTSPNNGGVLAAGSSTVDYRWIPINVAASEEIVLSLKRDAVPEGVTQPNGSDWHRFELENSLNDRVENGLLIPEEICAADDWRFYVGHVGDDGVSAFDGSDSNHTILSSEGCEYGLNANQAKRAYEGSLGSSITLSFSARSDQLQEPSDLVDATTLVSTGGGGGGGTSIQIDIKPGSDDNPINYVSQGKIPVAILSSADFDAPTVVDQPTLRFGRTGNEESLHYRGNGQPNCSGDEDHNDDGLNDLKCLFHTPIAGFQPGDTEGILRGLTFGGEAFEGRDVVRIVGPHIFSSGFESGGMGDWTIGGQ